MSFNRLSGISFRKESSRNAKRQLFLSAIAPISLSSHAPSAAVVTVVHSDFLKDILRCLVKFDRISSGTAKYRR